MKPQATFAAFAARLREFIRAAGSPGAPGTSAEAEARFAELAPELFALQFEHNAPWRRFCQARGINPANLGHWSRIPALPTAAFKELEVTCLPPSERTRVFHSSGTSGQRPSRHFHSAESLALCEASVRPWFARHLLAGPEERVRLLLLTPPAAAAPHSSLVHMFETVRQTWGEADSVCAGRVEPHGGWALELDKTLQALEAACASGRPLLLLGTAFNYVHLLDALASRNLRLALPAGSRLLETGGYKGRARALAKADLHAQITSRLGVSADRIVCEYGMCELSSQAYDRAVAADSGSAGRDSRSEAGSPPRAFRFPPWARAQLVSPETGAEVGEGETGLIRVYDLANVWSAMAIQTEDLGIRRGAGFELLGRPAPAETRGCSLLAVASPGAA